MSDDLSGATLAAVTAIVDRALDEDAPWGDATSEAAIPASATATARIVSRVDGVLAGGLVLELAFTRVDPTLVVERPLADGDPLAPGAVVATITGSARSILRGERVALNLAQRLSGVATLTRRYVDVVAGSASASGQPVRLVDTRKTTPGLRVLEKAAVRAGGGHNHRFSLSDAVMLKDNHLAVLREQGLDLTGAIRAVRARIPHTMHLEVEVDRLDQLPAVIAAEPDTIMLDNFGLDDLRTGVALIAGRATVEASGGVTLDTVRAIAETGVDVISVGALTHSAPALDLGLDIVITSGTGGAAGGAR
ncbi:carboxylating nicotinate-nucleotide diphosphorylase [Microcella frigidaquae]|uniref:Nicotinate-nucleotide pyrophosphorylase [carboxylating] n=1 Tax=Microcella frigidaquae TaxID=424758 RepID=A0A840XIM8_9MICO|nr:carboxylating nicotinate-nucleotide diphosphorylase [Microcella frigidaquae]MBB5616548.1 nicotinate-nucleotide pyrophosphorylase (carboxylating) [Microcella frigidaquae]NHN44841.1 carboxylating nicotinate-nucleotide diphosphorylase [Microcella frigidaquae]